MTESVVNSDKTLCSCGKSISKKNMGVHLKTAAHQPSVVTPIAVPLVENKLIENTVENKSNGSENKIKQRFDSLESKLDHLIDLLEEVADVLLGPDDENNNIV